AVGRGVGKSPPARQAERVERVGPVERDRRDPVTAVEDQRLEIRRSLLRVHRLVSDGGDSFTDSPRLRLRLARPLQVRQTRRRASCEATSRISWILSGFTRTRSTPCARRSSAESSTPKPVTTLPRTAGALP